MDKQSVTVVVLVLVSFLIAIFVAARFSGDEAITAPAAIEPIKKFRAKPGTERENARALVSAIPSAPSSNNPSSNPRETNKDREVWGRLDNPADTRRADAPSEWSADVADTAVFPTHAQQIRAYADGLAANNQTARIHPDYTVVTPNVGTEAEAAARAYQRALALATTRDQRLEATYLYANTLVQRGDPAAALDIIQQQTRSEDPASPRDYQLRALESVCLQQTGDTKQAVNVLLAIINNIEDQPNNPELRPIYRQAALRLTRLYESAGDQGAARRLRRRVEGWLATTS